MNRFMSLAIKQDLEVPNINHGYRNNTYIRKIDGCLVNLNYKAKEIDKTCEYWGWHMATWTYFPYTKDKKNRF